MATSRLQMVDVRWAAFIGFISTAPPIALLFGAGEADSLARLVRVTGLVAYGLVLGAVLLTYAHWRMICLRRAGEVSVRLTEWLTVGLTVIAVNGLLQVAILDPQGDGWPIIGQLLLLLLLCVVAAVAERIDVPGDPVLVCGVAAAAITAAYCLAMQLAPSVALSGSGATLLGSGVMVSGLLLAWIVLHRTKAPLWTRRRLAAAAVLLTSAQCVTSIDQNNAPLSAGAIAAFLLGALVLCTTSQQLLRRSVLEHRVEIDFLHRSLAEVRAAVLEDRQLLHEVGSTLAGITTATNVMREGQGVPAHRRQRLETMLASELARLQRLMHSRTAGVTEGEDRPIDVDDVVEPIVVSHQARGRQVTWQPCGREAVGDPDELAEVCNILLENAARHGGGTAVRLRVDADDDGVVVVCSDGGPGVAPELRTRIFDPDVKRPGSPGQGLGLAIVHQVASARGGSLELLDDDGPGATFVARLPRMELADDTACHVA
jgi:signal transduction histidine kinase